LAVSDVAIRFTCKACGKNVALRADLAGKLINCPGCGQTLVIPIVDDPATHGQPARVIGGDDLRSPPRAASPGSRSSAWSGAVGRAVDLEGKLRAQVENWRKRLLDVGNRNSLVNCSFNPSRGVLEIVHPECEVVWRTLAADSAAGVAPMRFPWKRELVPPSLFEKQANGSEPAEVDDPAKPKEWNPPIEDCLASPRLRGNDLLTRIGDKQLDRRLRTLDGYAELSMSEQGVHCLYVAFGFLKWFESVDSSEELWSPLMLVPVTLSRASADSPFELTEAEDDVVDNLCLRQRLKQDFGLELPALPDIDQLEEGQARIGFLDAVREAIADNDRWVVEDRCALGRFAFPKIAMWKDLGDHIEAIISHALCRSIAGDSSIGPQQAFGPAETVPDASRLDDEVPPGQVKAILDCDSSQLEAIVAARKGVSFVLDGPPGTGKSQTIANIIADALAEGRRVLFVSEKISALEVVKRRLDDCGLGDFCLECHSSKANRKAVLDDLQWCLGLPTEVYDDATPKLAEVKQKRSALNEYVRSVHRPREPFGLSPFELYGRVARLSRLGSTTKSRCLLPDPTGVGRDVFDAWLGLVGRSSEVGDVIARHDVHPWRGCKLASRSLSLADDLQHHLRVLSTAFETIDTATRPLTDCGLLWQVAPARLNEAHTLLRKSLTSPEVPAPWFANPEAIAKAVLEIHEARRVIDEHRPAIAQYVDDVASRFPEDDVATLNQQGASPWTRRLVEPLPIGVREQCNLLAEHVAKLRGIAARSAETETAISNLIAELSIPVKLDVTTAAVPKLIRLARAIGESGPMRPGWFEAASWTRVRQVCHDAIEKLDAAEAAALRLSGRIRAGRLSELSQAAEGVEAIDTAWQLLQHFSAEAKTHDLTSLARLADEASGTLKGVAEAVCSLAKGLGIVDGYGMSLRAAGALAELIGPLAETGVFHGSWSDARTRTGLREACNSSINDLTEAASLREALQERLSHRAFKSSAADLARRSAAYASVIKRLLGGFGAFRREAADLYKSNAPDTTTLLANFAQLRTFHHRLGDVRETAAELTDALPEGFVADDPASWNRVLNAISAFESLLNSVPELAASLPPNVVQLDPASVPADQERLLAELARFRIAGKKAPFDRLYSDTAILRDIANEISSVAAAAQACSEFWERTAIHYDVAPPDFGALLADVHDARRYTDGLSELSAIFNREQDLVPRGSMATDRATWERMRAGVEAAERISGLVRPPEVIRDVLCEEGRIDAVALGVAADTTNASIVKLDTALCEVAMTVVLSPPDEVVVDPQRRPLAVLRSIAGAAAEEFEGRFGRLKALADLIRPAMDVPVDRLPLDLVSVVKTRDALQRRAKAEESLRLNGTEIAGDLADGGYEAATWLLDVVTNGAIPSLAQAVASDGQQRQRVQRIADVIKDTLNPGFAESWTFLKSVFDLKANVFSDTSILATPIGELANCLSRLRGEAASLDEWLKFSRWQRDMNGAGFGAVVGELLERRFEAHETADVVAVRIYRKLFDHLAEHDKTLGEFDIEEHERLRQRFRQLDEWEVKAAATRIRQYQLGRDDRPRAGWTAAASSELAILQRETQKKRRHMPLRKLFADIPGVLQRLKPCIMMSPLSVSTFLQSDEIQFDMVIFDEASQVFPWDAIGAIYRAKQVIVAGDEKQLPPTNFFNRVDMDSDEEENDISDFGSILSLCKSIAMPNKGLRWHYRSRREPLIAFSNRHFYKGELVTFPSVRDVSSDAVRLEFVPNGRWIDRRNVDEAERIADLVIMHHRNRPKTSIGVIAFNSTQQQAIEDVIFERRRKDPVIDALFHVGSTEPMFIKNLENVQGDERDVILLSMGYARNDAGKFSNNFGPLTKPGGERRLNVAVTRAREEVVLVASVHAADMDLSGSRSEGAHLLKAYLDYAERGVDSLARTIDSTAGDCESPFEEEVAAALVKHGFKPVPQVGCGGFRIDLALVHPQRPGEFCLAVECDGATYHSSKTARDRDRIRQAVLEDLGWRIVRIWSTDWVRDPQRQLNRIVAAYDAAVSSAVEADALPHRRPNDTDGRDDDLQPRYVNHAESAAYTFSSIDEVLDAHIRASLKAVASRAGATNWDDLVKLVARDLGFSRTGKKIRERLEGILNDELCSGALRRVGDRVAAQASP